MRIAIRVDASNQIGTGHFIRCLTLADALQQRGALVRFVSRHMPGHLREMLAAKGHEFIGLDSGADGVISGGLVHAHWLGISQHADAQEANQVLSDQIWDWLIVDHYALDARWESALRKTAKSILVIDDIADRRHECNVLLDQNFYADMDSRYIGKVPSHCQLLLGPRYTVLREEFRQLRNQVKARTGPVRRILIFFGGVDAGNYTGSAIAALAGLGARDLHVDVVIGAQHPSREQIEAACAGHGFSCHVQTDRIAQLMAAADLAIGAGGTATWERCCMGLPTLTICAADNQSRLIADAASEGLLYAPDLKGELMSVIQRHVSALMENGCLRHFISRNAMQAVDGSGVLRVIGQMGCSGIEIRAARKDDSQNLFEWRNHPAVRAVSRSAELISWEDHQKWLASVLGASDRLLLIGQREGLPLGVVRFDIHGDEAEVSIYIVPGVKRSGQGRDLLQSAERWFAANRPEVGKIRAQVLGGNEPSRGLFLGAGYRVESACYSKRLHY